jgi:hypothetical protein
VTEPPFDVSQAHRWFAEEFNNRGWDLVESSDRSAAQIDEMISAAHAANVHWRAVGDPVNLLRAECLLATAYAWAGLGQEAVDHAEKCLLYSEQVGTVQSDFDRASAHGCAAAAYACAGSTTDAIKQLDQLRALTTNITDTGERELLSKLYDPTSGLR